MDQFDPTHAGPEFLPLDFDQWRLEPEFSKRGFAIQRLVEGSDRVTGFQLRPFRESGVSIGHYEVEPSVVSLVPLKRMAVELLPMSSDLRELIVSEPDSLPREVALAKVEVFSRLLLKELGRA